MTQPDDSARPARARATAVARKYLPDAHTLQQRRLAAAARLTAAPPPAAAPPPQPASRSDPSAQSMEAVGALTKLYEGLHERVTEIERELAAMRQSQG